MALESGDTSVRLAASIDTGATFCLFRAELATALRLDLTSGELKRFRTANGNFDAYGNEVELSVLGLTTFSTVYFFADGAINKNVAGRVGWLDRERLGLVEHDSHIYFARYEQA